MGEYSPPRENIFRRAGLSPVAPVAASLWNGGER